MHCGATIGSQCHYCMWCRDWQVCFYRCRCSSACSVPDYAIVMGVPARCEGWMCQCGHRLEFNKYDVAICHWNRDIDIVNLKIVSLCICKDF